ncbi:hypothetical protein HG535_0C00540 [Zygotorulaspora mrakii]|uniref:Protein ILM1 n=1 Tax=Zygotorulaspora mrakii TaxID=42260 RepID=A0A7H9AZ60_ZYGMR|nr:uncharacterized protein HG535_0C00540 [Zygotorulaspora mrakii]QLG71705.1 hypothetical protein HG535_0C00540 [Zygotorulaspora mrakii]
MATISSSNGLFLRVAFLFALAYFCFIDVSKILESSYFLFFTHAMNLPGLLLSKTSAQVGIFGLLFLLLALHDLVPLVENNKAYFNSVVPIRLMVFFVLTAMSYLWESNLYVHNNVVFTYSFVEVWINFVVLGALREEKNNDMARFHPIEAEEELEDTDPILTDTNEIEQLLEVTSAEESQ